MIRSVVVVVVAGLGGGGILLDKTSLKKIGAFLIKFVCFVD